MKSINSPFSLNRTLSMNNIYQFICVVICIRILTRCVQGLGNVRFEYFNHAELWQGLFITVVVFLGILAMAFMYSRWLIDLPLPVIFSGMLLFLYNIVLGNLLLFNINDLVMLRGTLLILLIPLLIQLVSKKKQIIKQEKLSIKPRVYLPNILIILWMIHAVVYFFEYNFNPFRVPYGDENSLWFVAAQNMSSNGYFYAHQASYPASGLHPYGIPFISSLPNKMLGFPMDFTITFMPALIIIFLCVILNQIKSQRWVFIFFYSALFLVFHQRNWMSQLMYHLVYGEGLTTLFFLIVIMELYRLDGLKKINQLQFLLMSFIIGLMAISKSPLASFSGIFYLFLLNIYYRRKINHSHQGKIQYFQSFCMFLIPLFSWQLIKIKFSLSGPWTVFQPFHIFTVILHPNIDMWCAAVRHLISDSENFVYFLILSPVVILISLCRKLYRHAAIILLFILTVVFYYGYVYQGTDYQSTMRYIMPCSLALFYLGGQGYERVMNKIETLGVHQIYKMTMTILSLSLIIWKMF